jgi:hypothetical protein
MQDQLDMAPGIFPKLMSVAVCPVLSVCTDALPKLPPNLCLAFAHVKMSPKDAPTPIKTPRFLYPTTPMNHQGVIRISNSLAHKPRLLGLSMAI